MKKILILLFIFISLFACSQNKTIIQNQSPKVESIYQTSEEEIIDLGDGWFEVTASAIIENITPEEAKDEAIKRACKNVIEYYQGVEVNARTLDILSESNERITEFFSQIVNFSSKAIILEKQIINEEIITDGNILKKVVTLKVKIGKQKGEKDPYFNLSTELNKTHFQEGEKLELSITPSQDCYLSIFCLYSNETVSILLPNEYKRNNFAETNKVFKLPSEKDVFSLTLGLLPSKNEDTETLIIIATKKPIYFPSFKNLSTYNTYESSLKELMYQLSRIPRSEMEEIVLQYYIYK